VQDSRLLIALQGLLALHSIEFKPALDEASHSIAEVLGADNVDVFLFEPGNQVLVAVGISDTRIGQRERATGLDRLPIANGGGTVHVFETGEPYLNGRADRDPRELKGVVEGLGVRSIIGVPLIVSGERRGVLLASSAKFDFFSERDLRFLEAVAHGIGLVGRRAAVVERIASDAAMEGLRLGAEELVGALSPRQREVAGLIARGLSNAQIAERLVLTKSTVANHVERILSKLGFRSRSQVAVWAAERGLHRVDEDDPSITDWLSPRLWSRRTGTSPRYATQAVRFLTAPSAALYWTLTENLALTCAPRVAGGAWIRSFGPGSRA
jgi:DNA-binding CsgD family transcriptional regulator